MNSPAVSRALFGLFLLFFAAGLLTGLVSCGLGGKRGITPVRTPYNKGVYHYSGGRWDAAIEEFRLALEDDPTDHRARFNLALALEARARQLETANEATASERLRRQAADEYRRLTEERPGELRAWVNLAATEYAQGRDAEGEAILRAALEREPDSVLVRVALASHRLRLAAPPEVAEADRERALEEALVFLEGAVAAEPNHLVANMLLGNVYQERGEAKQARGAYARALERRPADIATLLALARLEAREGHSADAAVWAQRTLLIDPDHLEAHLLLSRALEIQGDLEGATIHLWRARRLDDPRAPRRQPQEYRKHLLDLYGALAETEGGRALPATHREEK